MAYSVIFSIFGNFTDYCILGDFWHFRSFLVIFDIFADFCYFCIRKYLGKYLDNISAALKTPQIFAQICAVKKVQMYAPQIFALRFAIILVQRGANICGEKKQIYAPQIFAQIFAVK